MHPFTLRKRTSTRTGRTGNDTAQQVLARLDDAHRTELETMLEDRSR